MPNFDQRELFVICHPPGLEPRRLEAMSRCQHGEADFDPRPLRHALKNRIYSRVLLHRIRKMDERRVHIVSRHSCCDSIDVSLNQKTSCCHCNFIGYGHPT